MVLLRGDLPYASPRYQKAVSYWDQQEASYNGVLGGFGYTSDLDVRDSRALLLKAMRVQLEAADKGTRTLTALDCGAGVGRVTEQLLRHHFHCVDLLEPSRHLLDTAAGQFFCSGLQVRRYTRPFCALRVFVHGPCRSRYDAIWIQWCLLYLTDVDFVSLFQRAVAGLKPDGLIFVKENICKEGFVLDKEDSSLTRSNAFMLELFQRAGVQVLYNVKQRNWPKELFEVRMYVVKPRTAQQNQQNERHQEQ
ncbi:hypothetical protein VOLCADRAFT_55463 [Volvox carteri f. nagariensis]|uniref:Alpha N-terminal protein methyltransferase 1 n=1 Tax=Volvox carteri f. nagariensis TaxID=3068 RepID=D8TI95_VOLCA|nr:uncharacterized protein VOLCADRAFT_55463 [Volvox carteri f. nagariensis]EFJ52851.1 hypothetical protein VOLCADRAFT_55463 [Volvox carteri f. nagariensis]|eukprot:XP_002945856.1 hypothetical protein VOLCADRAFT_55463 [Volvox carteri f. nagariensis]